MLKNKKKIFRKYNCTKYFGRNFRKFLESFGKNLRKIVENMKLCWESFREISEKFNSCFGRIFWKFKFWNSVHISRDITECFDVKNLITFRNPKKFVSNYGKIFKKILEHPERMLLDPFPRSNSDCVAQCARENYGGQWTTFIIKQ